MEFFNLLIGCVFITLKSATALECYTCTSQPANPDATTSELTANNCDDPFNMTGIAKATCTAGSCFAKSLMESNITISERGCLPMGKACLQGCQWRSGPPHDGSLPQFGEAPPGAYNQRCNYCCDDNLCNGMPITSETAAAQYAPTPVEGSRMCWKCEEAKADATAGSCASDDFNGKGATKVDCNSTCVTQQGVDTVYRDCDPSAGGIFCQALIVDCCTEELCNGDGGKEGGEEGSEEGDNEGGAPAVASSSAAIFVGTLFVILAFM